MASFSPEIFYDDIATSSPKIDGKKAEDDDGDSARCAEDASEGDPSPMARRCRIIKMMPPGVQKNNSTLESSESEANKSQLCPASPKNKNGKHFNFGIVEKGRGKTFRLWNR